MLVDDILFTQHTQPLVAMTDNNFVAVFVLIPLRFNGSWHSSHSILLRVGNFLIPPHSTTSTNSGLGQ